MIRKMILPLIAVVGIVFAIYSVKASQKELAPAAPVAPPPASEFSQQISGAGIIEPEGENIAIGTIVPGAVENVFVKVGDKVKKGDKLFSVDSQDLLAELKIREAAVIEMQQKYEELKARPRPEDIPPAEAKIAEMKASVSDKSAQYNRLKGLRDSNAVGEDEFIKATWSVEIAKAQLKASEADLERIKAGAWEPELKVAQTAIESAKAQVEALKIEWKRRTVYAPTDGTIIQVKVRIGEYAPAGVMATPLMVLGKTDQLCVRVDIDENDAWRLKPGSPAVAKLRGNSELKTNLTFSHLEPYVVPKKSLTGESTERVDTRVLQVIYKIQPAEFPIYVGQQMDVSIDATTASKNGG